ncbi:MAG: tryptophan--tRNA ligase [Myxococcales bacterium]|nr:tryptophan--tRNA ligase [Myxococcota bacterium]MDW8280980.1 tryptophan--tRNA ligase [Myxococcales bacterium]
MRILSGVQPSGPLHLGNYFGAIQQHIELQEGNEAFYFIANYHAMTTVHDPELLSRYTHEVAVDYLALGLDPTRAVLFRQSDVPEVQELAWILATVTGKGLLDRAHSYKDKIQRGIVPSMGLYYYPVLMAADILLYRADQVPVGQDQVQHIEMTQDMAQSFNHTYRTDVLKRPEPRLNRAARVPGIDGEKMSKSYHNTIGIFEPPGEAKKKIMSIKTDSTPVADPKDPARCNVLALLRLLAGPEEVADWEDRYRKGGVGYGQVKTRLYELYEERFAPLRERRERLAADRDYVEDILRQGARRARAEAHLLLEQVWMAVGLPRRRQG